MLAVCDDNLCIMYYFIGAYGSAHDKRVYRCSKLPEKLSSLPPEQLILGKYMLEVIRGANQHILITPVSYLLT